jgi:CelD/BcsL family acetyltransferase involved in cellulose biosynthesis
MGWGVSDYSGPLVAPDSGADGSLLLSAMRAMARLLRCSLIALERNPGILGGGPNPLVGQGFRELHYASHYALVPADLPQFLKDRFGAKGSYNLRRSEKRLCGLGRLEFVLAEDEAQRSAITAAMVRHKRERYRAQSVRDNFEDPSFARFYEAYGARVEGGAHVSALFLDGRPIAEHWGVRDGDRMYLLMPTFEAGELEKYSPGSILIERLFALCMGEGIRVLDFTAGDEEYKDRWCEGRMPLFWRVEGLGAWGRARAFAIAALEASKRGILLRAGRAARRFLFSRRYRSSPRPN